MTPTAGSTDVKIKKLDHTTTMRVNVHVTREFRARFWLAKHLIRLAAWVLGCRAIVSEQQGD